MPPKQKTDEAVAPAPSQEDVTMEESALVQQKEEEGDAANPAIYADGDRRIQLVGFYYWTEWELRLMLGSQ